MEPGSQLAEPPPQREPPARRKKKRLAFDIAFGIVLPIICFIFDPIVFTSGGRLGGYRAFANCALVLVLATLVAWMRLREYEGRGAGLLHGILAGALLVAAYLAGAIGIAILPMSIIGLLFIIGILGFTPFLSALVYGRNAIAAIRSAKRKLPLELLLAALLLGAIVMAGPPAGVQWGLPLMADGAIDVVLQPGHPRMEPAIRKLRALHWLGVTDVQPIALAYFHQLEQRYHVAGEPERLAEAYRRVTGIRLRDPEEDVNNFAD